MKLVLFSGSMRSESLNKKLIFAAQSLLSKTGNVESTVIDLKGFHIPVYDGDTETSAFPDGVRQLGSQILTAEALIISSPEYNGSIAGPFKNIIDWLSRLKPVPLAKKPLLLLGASPGALGAVRGLSQTRIPLEGLGAFVFPQTFGLPRAHEAFSPEGNLADSATLKKFTELLTDYLQFAKKLNS